MRRAIAVGWLAAALLGAVHAWAERTLINADGVSYLEIADAYRRGDWAAAINAYWSPLFSWILAGVMALIHPAPDSEFVAAHVAAFLIYLLALGAFSFLLHEAIATGKVETDSLRPGGTTRLPVWAWAGIGYALFLWSSLIFIGLGVKPDLLVSAIIYVEGGLLLRMRREPNRLRLVVALGATLGLGYLAKAAMFPLAFVFLAVMPGPARLSRRVRRAIVGLAAFALVSAPFVAALSGAKGRLTFGEAGRLNYAWFINGVPQLHWQGAPDTYGTPQHPERLLLEHPVVFGYADRMGGAYPPWYDPTYRYEGVSPHLVLRQQLPATARNLRLYLDYLLFGDVGSVAVGVFVLFWLAPPPARNVRGLLRHPELWLPAVAALAMYTLVLVDRRYIGGFVLLLWIGLLGGLRIPDTVDARRAASAVTLAIVAIAVARVGLLTIQRLGEERGWRSNDMVAVADGLRAAGVREGDPVACIGRTCLNYEWARLARVRIVAEMPPAKDGSMSPDEERFWRAAWADQARVFEAFTTGGARAVIMAPPRWATPIAWRPLGNGGTTMFDLRSGR